MLKWLFYLKCGYILKGCHILLFKIIAKTINTKTFNKISIFKMRDLIKLNEFSLYGNLNSEE